MIFEGTVNGKEWFLSYAAHSYVDEVIARWPDRDTASDGTLGDTAHMEVVSDHNPDWNWDTTSDHYGAVRAVDIDADLDRKDPEAMYRLSRQTARYAKRHRTIAYVIFDEEICSPVENWTWRPYFGTNPHIDHMHLSFTRYADLRLVDWDLRIFGHYERLENQLRHLRHDLEYKIRPDYRTALRDLNSARRRARNMENILAGHKAS